MNHTESILSYLEQINRVPRKSGNSGPITDWLEKWGKERGYESRRDSWNNLVIKIPGTKGYEKAPIIILQGHSDMVCEKNPETVHDFSKDPVKLVRKGDWVRGDGTTLGADNGIALALVMDIVSAEDAEHPPLEFLITSDEEIGLIGANNIGRDFLEGRILVNLDSEEEGIFTIGCAGGEDCHIGLEAASRQVPSGSRAYTLTVGGLKGGHSGSDINKNLGNAIKMVQRVLSDLSKDELFFIASISGGSGATNAICRNAKADFVVSENCDIQNIISDWAAWFKDELGAVEEDLFVDIQERSAPAAVLDRASGLKVLQLLHIIPHGVDKMSTRMPGQVNTSSNLAWVSVSPEKVEIFTSQRSSIISELEELTLRVTDAALLAGGTSESLKKYPPWAPNPSSPLLDKCMALYKDVSGKEPVVETIHAGLECGLIGAKYPGMDMISIGPTIQSPHTPEERLYVPSLAPFRDFLDALLKSFK